MNVDLKKLNDFNMFEIVHNGNLYRATIRKVMFSDYPFILDIEYIDMEHRSHPEFGNAYKTAKAALNRMNRYWKGETVEWKRI